MLLQHGDDVFIPVLLEGITWTTERKGCPGQLDFKILNDGVIKISEGDPVRFKVDGQNVFYGFVFKMKRSKDQIIQVTAYDQMRYLKNKDTKIFENITASGIIKTLADDFQLKTDDIEDTEFKIASRVEENTTLFDMIQNALDLTLQNKGKMYVLYDNFGKLTLKSLENMQLNVLIDEETGENFDYESSIDSNTYNKIKLTFDNEKTGKREVYISQDSKNMNQWGVLQYFDTLQENENGKAKADALLKLYNAKTRSLSINKAFGDIRVRGGSMVVVMLDLGDMKVNTLMLVEKCKHEFNEGLHTMTLNLRGGDFVV